MRRAIWELTKLFFQTFRLIGLAIFELAFLDREDTYGTVPKMENPPPPPRKLTPRELEARRLRKEQELVEKFKAKL